MATVVKSATVLGTKPVPNPIDMATVTVVESLALTAAQVAANVVVALAILPAGAVPLGYTLDADDIDTGATVTMDVGILADANAVTVTPQTVNSATQVSALAANGGGKWVTASTLGQAGGILLHTASKAAYDLIKAVTAVDYDRVVGVVFPAGSTGQAGTLKLELAYTSKR